ncbi:14841_t:CDS:2 [Dentiscutata erythropus]|uniref:14841_t:CDS:1 n=1 Tax=Dentiscutata erythropus TaxID=1348616 RepID=A0A9N9EXW6_9GLOM|nr:14841_t:CDS:2 [Dentiscutata erythropus]
MSVKGYVREKGKLDMSGKRISQGKWMWIWRLTRGLHSLFEKLNEFSEFRPYLGILGRSKAHFNVKDSSSFIVQYLCY